MKPIDIRREVKDLLDNYSVSGLDCLLAEIVAETRGRQYMDRSEIEKILNFHYSMIENSRNRKEDFLWPPESALSIR